MGVNIIGYEGLRPFSLFVSKNETVRTEKTVKDREQHAHAECEIYINLSGDVSFMVENSIYPICTGSIVICRPFENHHCIYHSDETHRHYWILFSSEGNEDLFDAFFKREKGTDNLRILPPEKTVEMIGICDELLRRSENSFSRYLLFFRLIGLIGEAEHIRTQDPYPADLQKAVIYINEHLSECLTVEALSAMTHVSVNTLERHFDTFVGRTPSGYIRQKRLANAAMLLHDGCSVGEAAERSGFSDYSNFILLFRKYYGTTPLKYQKNGGKS